MRTFIKSLAPTSSQKSKGMRLRQNQRARSLARSHRFFSALSPSFGVRLTLKYFCKSSPDLFDWVSSDILWTSLRWPTKFPVLTEDTARKKQTRQRGNITSKPLDQFLMSYNDRPKMTNLASEASSGSLTAISPFTSSVMLFCLPLIAGLEFQNVSTQWTFFFHRTSLLLYKN